MNYDREEFNAFIECNKQLEAKKIMIIRGQYRLQSKEDYDELKKSILALDEKYASFESANPNLHTALGKYDNKLFSNLMVSIFENLDSVYNGKWEEADFDKIKKAIRSITVYHEFEHQLDVMHNSTLVNSEINNEDAPIHLDANGNMIAISNNDAMKSQFNFIVEQQKKLQPKYEEAHEFIFGTRTEENSSTKTM